MKFKPRFTLRTLFVLVALSGIPMGWVAFQLSWIRQRHFFIANHGSWSGHRELPLGLATFGETPRLIVYAPQDEQKRAAELFPEAMVIPLPLEPEN